jgi:hypothetical protein
VRPGYATASSGDGAQRIEKALRLVEHSPKRLKSNSQIQPQLWLLAELTCLQRFACAPTARELGAKDADLQ